VAVHLNEDETFYVLDGTPTFHLADELTAAWPARATGWSSSSTPDGVRY